MINLESRRSGILLHISSLPSPHGVGDFGPDAYRFVDWLNSAGQRVWQWLPCNPIGPGNSPYQSVSAFAGSPLMVALEPLVSAGWLQQPVVPEGVFVSDRVVFEQVVPWRLQMLRAAQRGFSDRATSAQKREFSNWVDEQAYWLDDYTLFAALETAHAGQPWWDWPSALAHRDSKSLRAARKEYAEEIGFWQFVQWSFDRQARALKAYANERDVIIMGDLPIFVAHHSADCWARPDLYELDAEFQPTVVAGVPPDDLGPLGQRWGNPLYRWERMQAEDFSWWVARIRRALDHADVFRIDHFRGFAAYWEIPSASPTAEQGRWVPAPGKALFAAIDRALGRIPIVAEDLGLITPDVLELRDSCGFPGMKILQFGFSADGEHEFLPHNYAKPCVAYTGTHDNDTVHGWWRAASVREREFVCRYLATGPADIHWAMIRSLCNSVANTVIFPLQDVLGLDGSHRMNIPGTLGGSNWCWRFDWEMLGSEPTRVLGLITAGSGRGPFALLGLPSST